MLRDISQLHMDTWYTQFMYYHGQVKELAQTDHLSGSNGP